MSPVHGCFKRLVPRLLVCNEQPGPKLAPFPQSSVIGPYNAIANVVQLLEYNGIVVWRTLVNAHPRRLIEDGFLSESLPTGRRFRQGGSTHRPTRRLRSPLLRTLMHEWCVWRTAVVAAAVW